jgi:hypothetical protein
MILLSHFPLPPLGSTSTTAELLQLPKVVKGASELNGEHVPAQFPWTANNWPSHTGTTPLQLGLGMGTLSSLMQSLAARWLFFLGIQRKLTVLSSHQMGSHLYLEVMTRLSSSGICRLVGLSRPSMVTLGFGLFPSQQTHLGLPQDLEITQFVCGTFRQGSAFAP